MDFYCFHKWLQNFKNYHKYLYIVLIAYVVVLTVVIAGGLMIIGPVLLATFVNPWLAFVAVVTLPLGVLFTAFIFDLFDM